MSFADRDGFIWMDGKLIPWREATTHFLTHSLHYGVSVFEGVRAYKTAQGTAIFRLKDHTRRLLDSAKILQMKVDYSEDELNLAQLEVVKKSGLESCYIRPLIYYGSAAMGIAARNNSVHIGIAAWAWGAYLGAEGLEKGIRVKTSSYTRHHVNVTMCRAKAGGNYINSVLANREAIDQGFDEALLLDTEGYVAEGAGENIFVIRDGVVYTPDLASCLDGITRRTALQILSDLNIPVREGRLTRDAIYIADEAFFTGTAAEITPIRELDTRPIGKGSRGTITEKVQKAFFDIVSGKNEKYSHWLSHV